MSRDASFEQGHAIADDCVVVRGGQGEPPPPGTEFSASVGVTLDEAAAGVPHGFIRWTTVARVRADGGRVTHAPELDPRSGTINRQHVHVVEGGAATAFATAEPNPVPKRRRFGGPDYREPDWAR